MRTSSLISTTAAALLAMTAFASGQSNNMNSSSTQTRVKHRATTNHQTRLIRYYPTAVTPAVVPLGLGAVLPPGHGLGDESNQTEK